MSPPAPDALRRKSPWPRVLLVDDSAWQPRHLNKVSGATKASTSRLPTDWAEKGLGGATCRRRFRISASGRSASRSLDGFQVLMQIKANPALRSTPVIFFIPRIWTRAAGLYVASRWGPAQECVTEYHLTAALLAHFKRILESVVHGQGQGFWVQAEYGAGKTIGGCTKSEPGAWPNDYRYWRLPSILCHADSTPGRQHDSLRFTASGRMPDAWSIRSAR